MTQTSVIFKQFGNLSITLSSSSDWTPEPRLEWMEPNDFLFSQVRDLIKLVSFDSRTDYSGNYFKIPLYCIIETRDKYFVTQFFALCDLLLIWFHTVGYKSSNYTDPRQKKTYQPPNNSNYYIFVWILYCLIQNSPKKIIYLPLIKLLNILTMLVRSLEGEEKR